MRYPTESLMVKRGLLRAKIEKRVRWSHAEETLTSHKKNGAAKLFSNLQHSKSPLKSTETFT
jgi:hypothetical protein